MKCILCKLLPPVHGLSLLSPSFTHMWLSLVGFCNVWLLNWHCLAERGFSQHLSGVSPLLSLLLPVNGQPKGVCGLVITRVVESLVRKLGLKWETRSLLWDHHESMKHSSAQWVVLAHTAVCQGPCMARHSQTLHIHKHDWYLLLKWVNKLAMPRWRTSSSWIRWPQVEAILTGV